MPVGKVWVPETARFACAPSASRPGPKGSTEIGTSSAFPRRPKWICWNEKLEFRTYFVVETCGNMWKHAETCGNMWKPLRF